MTVAILYNPEIQNYDFGFGHSFRGERFSAFLKAFHELFGRDPNFQLVIHDKLADDEELRLWHTQDYIHILRAASEDYDDENDALNRLSQINSCLVELGPKKGPCRQSLSVYLSQDNLCPYTGRPPAGIEKAARAIVKNTILAVDSVMQNQAEKAVSIGGGLHHAKPGYGEGFCFYNDVVIAAKYARQQYKLDRILILDTDAHAGNGTCEAFYADPGVLFIDLHEKGIYPGTGRVDEIGAGEAKGFTVNIPLESGTGDAAYERIFEKIIFPLARDFRPQLILRNGGSDPHFQDSLTSLGMTLAGFWMTGDKVRQLADELCKGKSIDLIGSGYNPDILPRAWLSIIAGLSGKKVNFEESSLPPGLPNPADIEELIEQLKSVLKPYWKSMRS